MREILQMDRIMEKLTILSAAARYDVACTSSGVQRGGDGTHTGNAYASGICHAFTGDGRCISLLKILYTNDCIYDCKYCRNRCSNDVKRVRHQSSDALVYDHGYRRRRTDGRKSVGLV